MHQFKALSSYTQCYRFWFNLQSCLTNAFSNAPVFECSIAMGFSSSPLFYDQPSALLQELTSERLTGII